MRYILFGDDYPMINFDGIPFRNFMAELTLRLMTTLTSCSNALLGSWFIKLKLTKNHKKLFQMIKTFKTICTLIVQNKIAQNKSAKSGLDDMLTHIAREHIENPKDSLNVEEIVG
jgi:hypothetical protein